MGTHAGLTGLVTASLNNTATAEQLIIVANAFPSTAYWYQGYAAVSGTYTWGANNGNQSSPLTNFSSDPAGTMDAGQVPGPNTDVVFTAANLSGSNITSIVATPFTINSLTFNANPASVSISGSTISINALASVSGSGSLNYAAGTGIVDSSTSTVTIADNLVAINNQSWSNNSTLSGTSLVISGNIAGAAGSGTTTTITLGGSTAASTLLSGAISDGAGGGKLALTVSDSGSGITILSGSDSYTGATTVSAGTLNLTGTLNGSSVTTSGSSNFIEASSGLIAGTGVSFTQASSSTTTFVVANTFTGGLNVYNGGVVLSASGAIGSGTITLGDASGNSASLVDNGFNLTNVIKTGVGASAATLTFTNNTGSVANTFPGAIVLNGTDTLTLATTGTTLSTFSGGVSGTGNLILKRTMAAADFNGSLLLSTTVNNVGTITVPARPSRLCLLSSAPTMRLRSSAPRSAATRCKRHGITLNTPSALLLDANNSSFRGAITINSGALLGNNNTNVFGTGAINLAATLGNTALLNYGGRLGNVARQSANLFQRDQRKRFGHRTSSRAATYR